ncbi:SdrD B-like domain-containing protein [Nostoc sp. UHCC 0870]|uniref:SdrD B-like domain-containing protein n=1 Tax=Nostoc sp. UHCC 0870 TaxID=2914041 RepID=UPI001EE00DE0|nr:SdrD B-like domain-containing protein [Nostoc sp. UHCC 0870]UKO98975.1 cadherin-like domain-containing protein [Nostoc sp. UHCC 0870]
MPLIDDLLQALKSTLPDNDVNLVVAFPGAGGDAPSYLDITITNGNFLNGLYDSYCIDANKGILPGQTYQAQVYSSYNDPIPTGIIDKPENLDEVNWLINQQFVGKQSSGGFGSYTSGDIQVAIWNLLENTLNTLPQNIFSTVGPFEQSRVDEIVNAALTNGAGFVPGISTDGTPQDIGIIVVPVDGSGNNIAQSTINILKTAALGDFVFEDLNANGIQDANEKGVGGVTVTLTGGGKDGVIGTADDTIVTTTTDADGSYLFPLLVPGVEYKVTFGKPNGFVFTNANQGDDTLDSDADPLTGMSQIIKLNPREFNSTIDAGIYKPAGLGNFVFEDKNGNGIQDAGDAGVGGVLVKLQNADGTAVVDGSGNPITTTTNANGGYSFTGLTPGEYKVMFVAPNGFEFTTANVGNDALDSDANPSNGMTQTVTLSSGEFNDTLDAGLIKPAGLGNFVFEDKNGNGIQDAGEAGVGGVLVKLQNADGTAVVDGSGNPITTTTNANGGYSFTGLTPGEYKVMFVAPNGFKFTTANVGNDALDSDANPSNGMTQTVTLSSGEFNDTLDAGLIKPAGLGNFVFEDKNGNGIQDAGDAGVGGVLVKLQNADGTAVVDGSGNPITTTTNANGGYSFTGLTPGEYKVMFVAPNGFEFTTANVGNDALDSDADPTNGMTQTVTLSSGEFNDTLDAGIKLKNTAPDAKNDLFHYTENEGGGFYDGNNLLSNDFDVDGDGLHVTHVNGIEIGGGRWIHLDKGDVFVNQNGAIDFAAGGDFDFLKAGETRDVGFDYKVSDGKGGTDTAHVTLRVKGLNDAPDAKNDLFHYTENEGGGVYDGNNLLSNDFDVDGDGLHVTHVNGIEIGGGRWIHLDKGDVFVNQNGAIDFAAGGDFDFLKAGETRDVGFDYKVSDGKGGTDTANVTLRVKGLNDAPDAKNDLFHYTENEGGGVYDGNNLLSNDFDVDGDGLHVTHVNGIEIGGGRWIHLDKGDVFVNQNGAIDFAAGGDFDFLKAGETRDVGFDYKVSDGKGGTDTAHVTLRVKGLNDAPDAKNDLFHYTENEGGGVYDGNNLLSNDFDVDGDGLHVTHVNGIAIGGGRWIHLDKGDVFVNQNGAIDFATGGDFNFLGGGQISDVGFNYTVSDGKGGTDTAHVTLRVNGVNDLSSAILNSAIALLNISPIAFDLNGDGIQTESIDKGIKFDMLNIGEKVNTGWLSGEDGFLAIDNNGNGQIDDRSELFGGVNVGEGFAKLASFDSNGDGIVNANDTLFSELKLWQDANSNGITDQGELVSLGSAGITDLKISYTNVFSTDAQGNILGEFSSAVKNGSTIDMVDVYFRV